EEELLLVDPGSGEARPLSGELLDRYRVATVGNNDDGGPVLTAEFQQEMIEVVTPPHAGMAALEADIRAGRALADGAAQSVGARA
ncbi:glutamate-cysteine ligase family protein, partial [Arthrobacter sp. ZBG10]